jgi:hypothetical protein
VSISPDIRSALLQIKTCFSLYLCMFRVVIRTPVISHCVMSCFDLCFWLVCLQLETKLVNTNLTKCNAWFFFAYRLTFLFLVSREPYTFIAGPRTLDNK